MKWCLIFQTENVNTSGITSHRTESFNIKPITPGHPIPKISSCLAIFWGGTWKTEFVKTFTDKRGHHQKKIRQIAQEMLNRVVDNFIVRVLLIQQRSAWNEHSINYWKRVVKHYWFYSGLYQKNSTNFQYLWRKNLEGFLIIYTYTHQNVKEIKPSYQVLRVSCKHVLQSSACT